MSHLGFRPDKPPNLLSLRDRDNKLSRPPRVSYVV
jgi:hypothetical protein